MKHNSNTDLGYIDYSQSNNRQPKDSTLKIDLNYIDYSNDKEQFDQKSRRNQNSILGGL